MKTHFLALFLVSSSVNCQLDPQQQQQQFINQLRTQGFTDDQIAGFFQAQQQNQQRQQPPQQSLRQQPQQFQQPQQTFQQQVAQQQQQIQQQQRFQQPPQGNFGQIPQQQAFGQQPQLGQLGQQQQQFGQVPQQQPGFPQQQQQQVGGFGQAPLRPAPVPAPAPFPQPQAPVPQAPVTPASEEDLPKRSKVFFQVAVDGANFGRIELELFDEVVPKTTRNFVALASGQNKNGASYKNTIFHRIIPQFMIQGGDYQNFDGTGGESIYGPKFEDENFLVKHASPGLLSMANSGPNTNGAQFFITTAKTPWLDSKHVVFGRVDNQQSYDIVKRIESLGSDDGTPAKQVVITDSGVIEFGCSVDGDSRCPVLV